MFFFYGGIGFAGKLQTLHSSVKPSSFGIHFSLVDYNSPIAIGASSLKGVFKQGNIFKVLSETRAGSVKQYLIGNGVDESRITVTGHGINDPIADNKTAAGRAKNRRVEIKLRNY